MKTVTIELTYVVTLATGEYEADDTEADFIRYAKEELAANIGEALRTAEITVVTE